MSVSHKALFAGVTRTHFGRLAVFIDILQRDPDDYHSWYRLGEKFHRGSSAADGIVEVNGKEYTQQQMYRRSPSEESNVQQ